MRFTETYAIFMFNFIENIYSTRAKDSILSDSEAYRDYLSWGIIYGAS